MDAFISRKKRKLDNDEPHPLSHARHTATEDDSTELKLAILASLNPNIKTETLLDVLASANGSVDEVLKLLTPSNATRESSPPKRVATAGIQSSLPFSFRAEKSSNFGPAAKPLTKKGKTLHLYSPEDIAAHTPCSIIHNFLPADLADSLLSELLQESGTFPHLSFRIFDNVVRSPHTSSFYVSSLDEAIRQKTEYVYNGAHLTDVRQWTPLMQKVSDLVREAVNKEIQSRIRTHYGGKKLRFQSPKEWQPNAAFVNHYAGGKESVGYHSDQLTYLGPRAIIGSLSLGVSREFRVRKTVPKDKDSATTATTNNSTNPTTSNTGDEDNASGQISLPLPHNSLLTMHAEMQEEWKHAVAPSQTITPHPISGTSRINITYRWYRDEFHPRHTPRCHCGVPCVLRCVQKKRENRGRYMWMCHAGFSTNGTNARPENSAQPAFKSEPDTTTIMQRKEAGKDTKTETSCTFFQWARFSDDGDPEWVSHPTPVPPLNR